MAPPPLQPDLFGVPQGGEAAPLLALMEMIRAQTVTMERNNEKVDRLNSAVAQVREDIAVLKAEGHRDAALATEVANLKAEVAALKLRNAQQDGGLKLATFAKDFLPWFVAVATAVFAFFKR